MILSVDKHKLMATLKTSGNPSCSRPLSTQLPGAEWEKCDRRHRHIKGTCTGNVGSCVISGDERQCIPITTVRV